jgi:phosphoribosylaminoimidazole-succinocarboxamide synthase
MNLKEIVSTFDEGQRPAIASGKSKIIYPTIDESVCLMKFKPHLRSVTYQREGNIEGTDYWRMLACAEIFKGLESDGIPTELMHNKVIDHNEQFYLAVAKVKPIPIEWICRYKARGSIVRLFPSLVKQGQRFNQQLQKYDFKQDVKVAGIDDPMLNESYIVGLGLMSESQLQDAKKLLYVAGEHIKKRLDEVGMDLADMKMEFGYDSKGKLIIIDEISQDPIAADDKVTGRALTKDSYRQLKSEQEVLSAYEEFAKRLNPHIETLVERY